LLCLFVTQAQVLVWDSAKTSFCIWDFVSKHYVIPMGPNIPSNSHPQHTSDNAFLLI